MEIRFEHDYQHKVLKVTFGPSLTCLSTSEDVQNWRQLWISELKSWHTPYKALIDCTHLKINHPDLKEDLERMDRILKGLHLKNAVGFGFNQNLGHDYLPFTVYTSENEALQAVGLRKTQNIKEVTNFRDLIHIENHFKQGIVEVSFSGEANFQLLEHVNMLKSKIFNALMQWHTAWALLIDCSRVTIAENLNPEFMKLQKFLKNYFMKDVAGFQVSASDMQVPSSFPFKVYRTRHLALQRLSPDQPIDGDQAGCQKADR